MKAKEQQKRHQFKFIVIFSLVLLVLSGTRLNAQMVVDIPDANLEAAIREALGIPTDPLTNIDLFSLTVLQAPTSNITNLTGLEYCVNLGHLWLSENNISDLNPLSGLTNLTDLVLYENNINDISPIAGLINLIHLDLSENNISDISLLADLINITDLRLNSNNISDITPISGLTNLLSLEIEENTISDISPVADLTNLTVLFMDGNNYSDISPVSGLINLTQLDLGANVSDISSLSELTNLEVLLLSTNNITDISPLAGMTNLRMLFLQRNNISDISTLAGLTNLTVLAISSNNISDFSPIAGLTNLQHLNLETTNISDISVLAGLTNLTFLELDDNNINNISVIAGLANLNYLELNTNNIIDIGPLADLMNLTYLDLEENPLNCEAHLTYIPLIIENNPDIEIYYDPMPPDCESINQPPEAVDDVVSTLMDMSVIIDVLSNDTDPDGDEIGTVQFTQPEHGDLVLNADDTFTYVPDEGFLGQDSFDYEISDGLLSATATVTIYVTDSYLPEEQIEEIQDFIEESVEDGTIVGEGSGRSAGNRLNALINMLEEASGLIIAGLYEEAYQQLEDVYNRCDGESPPPDFVTGEAASELAALIMELMDSLI